MFEEVLVFSSRCFSDTDTSVRNACDYMNLSADPIPRYLLAPEPVCNITFAAQVVNSCKQEVTEEIRKVVKESASKKRSSKVQNFVPKPENTWKCTTSTEREGTSVM